MVHPCDYISFKIAHNSEAKHHPLQVDFFDRIHIMNNEELVDLVDSQGMVRERNVPRSKVADYSDLHMQIVVAVITNDQGEYLVHQRALTKDIDPGAIDHVCGAVMAQETPEDAAQREALEETGVRPDSLQIVRQGVNSYGRYRYLLQGKATMEPGIADPQEAIWAKYISLEELQQKAASGEFIFVGEFFDDISVITTKRAKLKYSIG